MEIEPAEGGFIINCQYESSGPEYKEPEKKVAKSFDELYEILHSKLQ